MSLFSPPSDAELAPLDGDDEPKAGSALAFGSVFAGVVGVIALVVALVVGSGSGSGSSVGAGASPTKVTLAEFTITPNAITAVNGAGLDVTNNGTMQHNLAVEGTQLATPMIDSGKSAHLDLSSLKAGDYTVYCQVPGHKEAGMVAKLHLTAGSGSTSQQAPGTGDQMAGMDMSSSSSMTPQQMDQAMEASIKAFPAKTAGLGAQVLAPTILPDGTKQFDLIAAVTKWEVSPGKFVDAWTYNGTVPGPTLKVNPGDKVQVVLHNRLPESTSIHFHGLETPNDMDGTTYVTQPPVLSGQDFTYSWTAQSTPAVGMYHSHHDAVKQVPDGLAGVFLVGDEPVPSGVTVTQHQEMMLNDSGVISYAINGKSFPATAPIIAKVGDWVEVDYLNEGTQIHPMHLHGMPQVVIAKDGYPVTNPQEEDTVTVAPGERYTVLVHATNPGTWVWHCHILPHAENENGMYGMVTAIVIQ